MVAVMSYSGYDIEDAVIVNRASLDRGYGRVMVTKRYTTVLKKHDNNRCDDVEEIPKQTKKNLFWKMQQTRFDALHSDGVAEVGAKITKHGIMLNRVVPVKKEKDENGKVEEFVTQPVKYKESGEASPNEQSYGIYEIF